MSTIKELSILALKGMLIGATMLVPGLSGGTMALIIGIYEDLLHHVNQLLKRDFKSLRYLMAVGIGGILGLLIFTVPMRYLLEQYNFPMLWFFTGVIIGGIPVLIRESTIPRFSPVHLIPVFLGFALIMLISKMNSLFPNGNGDSIFLPLLLPFGFVAAVALILPGISISHILLVFGLYEPLLLAIRSRNMGFIVLLGIGILGGVFALTGILERIMHRFPEWTYLSILGFIIGSLPEVIPGFPFTAHSPLAKSLLRFWSGSDATASAGSVAACVFPLICGILIMTLFTRLGQRIETKPC